MPELPVLTMGDYRTDKPLDYVEPFDGKKFLWGRCLPWLYTESPFDKAMYLDADTEFVSSPTIFLLAL